MNSTVQDSLDATVSVLRGRCDEPCRAMTWNYTLSTNGGGGSPPRIAGPRPPATGHDGVGSNDWFSRAGDTARGVLDAARSADPSVQDVMLEIELDETGEWSATLLTSSRSLGAGGSPTVFIRDLALPGLTVPDALDSPPTDATVKTVTKGWERAKRFFAPHDPVSDAQIQSAESTLGMPLPPSLVVLLRRTNGADPLPGAKSGVFRRTAVAGWKLLSAGEIAEEWSRWCELARSPGAFDDVAFDTTGGGRLAPHLLHPGWIPFAIDGELNCMGIDIAPGPSGKVGQIVLFGWELNVGPGLLAHSLGDVLLGKTVAPAKVARCETTASTVSGAALKSDLQELDLTVAAADVQELVRRCPRLRSLTLDSAEVDLQDVDKLPLQSLSIRGLHSLDLEPLRHHPTLRQLWLGKPYKDPTQGPVLRHHDAIADIPHLQHLSLPVDDMKLSAPSLARHDVLSEVKVSELGGLRAARSAFEPFYEVLGIPPQIAAYRGHARCEEAAGDPRG